MKISKLLITLLSLNFGIISAQPLFHGSFLMSFKVAGVNTGSLFLWNIETASDTSKMAMEIQDDMKKKGVSKRVLFNPADSTWSMMIEFTKVKQGARIKAASMFKDSVNQKILSEKKTNETRTIEGYPCKKIILESEGSISEVWITDRMKFDLCNIYRLLSHCGMMNEYVRKGDWYFSKTIPYMILEVTSKDKTSGESYTMSITSIKPGDVNITFFTTQGFKISEIPEGQNCGSVMKNEPK